jgi:hypothetical protein
MNKIIFLHHSTGNNIWLGGTNKIVNKLTGKNSVQNYFNSYNKKYGTNYSISERFFPNSSPYGWKNYPYDYYNIWVKNAGANSFMGEPTLEILSKEYDVIIFKHCYPISKILKDTGHPDVNSEEKRLENYKLQYNALKKKLHEFQKNKFIIWTPSVHVKSQISEDEAKRTFEFYNWIIGEWKEKGDNIFVWDFYKLETEGGLYLKDEYSEGAGNSHPSSNFSSWVSPLFSKFIIDVIESNSEK